MKRVVAMAAATVNRLKAVRKAAMEISKPVRLVAMSAMEFRLLNSSHTIESAK